MVTCRLLTFVALLVSAEISAQENRYIVQLKDKALSPFSTTAPEQFLSTRAIARRTRQNISITADDLPVNAAYVSELRAAGAEVYFTSRWMNCVLIQTTPVILNTIKGLPFVVGADLVAPGEKLSGGRVKQIKNRQESGIAPATLSQLSMIGIDAMHTEGIRGAGVTVAVFDSGFEGVNTAAPFQHLFSDGRIEATFDFIGNSDLVFRYDDHGTGVFSVIAARSPDYTGGAPEATFHLYVTEDVSSEYRIEEYNWLFAAERADSAGVDIIQSSLGYNTFDDPSMDYTKTELTGTVALISQAARKAIEKGIVVVCSAGNEGNNSWGLVTPPADVDGILAVGSVTSELTKSTFSSRGPTSDNRIKPDVVALGSGTMVVRPSGVTGTTSGTSVAAPIITSLVAGILQRFPDLSVGEIYEAVTATASQASAPDNFLGYGLPNYPAIRGSLAEFSPMEEISIFPNPVTGENVKILLKTPNQNTLIKVYELHGRLLQATSVIINWQNNPLELDLANLPAGVYLVSVQTTNNFKTERIVKK